MRSRSLGALFSVFAPPFPPPAWLLGDGHFISLFTSTSYKGRVSYCGRQKIVVRNIKRNLPLQSISEKGWQPSQALGLVCDKWGIPRLGVGGGGCLLPACQVGVLCSWSSWHTLGGTHTALFHLRQPHSLLSLSFT